MRAIDGVLFDIDGTLVDSNELHVAAWVDAFADAGFAIDPAAIRGQIGKGGDKLVPALLPDIGATLAAWLERRHGDRFKARYLAKARPFPGARDLLARVHASGRKVVLASSASREELDHYVALLDTGGFVDAGTSIDDVGESKPAPDIFATALRKAGLTADRAIAVGDAPYDALSAGGSGIATVGLLSGGYAADVLEEAGVMALYADVAALLARFDESALAR